MQVHTVRRVAAVRAPLITSHGSLRHQFSSPYSPEAQQWLTYLRYGLLDCPEFGSWFTPPITTAGSAVDGTTMKAAEAISTWIPGQHSPRQVHYVKALIYASGGYREARDWIGATAAMTLPDNAELLQLALHYHATESDVAILREDLLTSVLKMGEDESGASATTAETDEEASSSTPLAEDGGAGSGPPATNPALIKATEDYVLQCLPETRCFLYDAMTASLQGCSRDIGSSRQTRRFLFDLGIRHFGCSAQTLTSMWRLVEAEEIVRKEKSRVLGSISSQ